MNRTFLIIAILVFGAFASQAQRHMSGYDLYKYGEALEKEHIPLIPEEVSMLPFRQGDSFGFVSVLDKSKWLIEPQYLQVYAVYKEGAIVRNRRGFGLINNKGEVVIPLQYLFLLKEGNKYKGYLGSGDYGQDTLPSGDRKSADFFQYFSEKGDWLGEQICNVHETFLGKDSINWFRRGEQFYIACVSGEILDSFLYNDTNKFVGVYDNLILYSRVEDTTNFLSAYDLDRNIQFSLKADFDDVPLSFCKMSDNLYGAVYSDNTYLFFDGDGNLLPYGSYSAWVGVYLSDINYFRKKAFMVSGENRKLGAVNYLGDTIIPFIYSGMSSMDGKQFYCYEYVKEKVYSLEDTAFTNKYTYEELRNLKRPPNQSKYHFINEIGAKFLTLNNEDGKQISDHFQLLQLPIGFYEGLCIGYKEILGDYDEVIIKQPDLKGNGSEKEIIYEVAPPKRKDMSYYYFFDTTGRIVFKLDTSIIFVGVFSSGLAPAMNKEKKVGFINKKGEWVIKPKYGIMYKGCYLNEQIVVPYFIGNYAYIKTHKGYIEKEGNEYFEGEYEED